ncbi:myb-like protein X [Ptychodera flava]|uniref:myb-like protein X n=1 Tax=Ptychodera flava TaxID=63121 RepID=UPI00396A76F8
MDWLLDADVTSPIPSIEDELGLPEDMALFGGMMEPEIISEVVSENPIEIEDEDICHGGNEDVSAAAVDGGSTDDKIDSELSLQGTLSVKEYITEDIGIDVTEVVVDGKSGTVDDKSGEETNDDEKVDCGYSVGETIDYESKKDLELVPLQTEGGVANGSCETSSSMMNDGLVRIDEEQTEAVKIDRETTDTAMNDDVKTSHHDDRVSERELSSNKKRSRRRVSKSDIDSVQSKKDSANENLVDHVKATSVKVKGHQHDDLLTDKNQTGTDTGEDTIVDGKLSGSKKRQWRGSRTQKADRVSTVNKTEEQNKPVRAETDVKSSHGRKLIVKIKRSMIGRLKKDYDYAVSTANDQSKTANANDVKTTEDADEDVEFTCKENDDGKFNEEQVNERVLIEPQQERQDSENDVKLSDVEIDSGKIIGVHNVSDVENDDGEQFGRVMMKRRKMVRIADDSDESDRGLATDKELSYKDSSSKHDGKQSGSAEVEDGLSSNQKIDIEWDGTTKDGTGHIGTTKDGTGHIGTTKVGTGHIGTTKVGTGHIGTTKVGTGHIGTTKVGTGHIGTTKVGTGHIGTTKVGTGHSGTTKVGTGHIGTTKVGTGHIGTTKVGTGHSGTTKVGTGHSGTTKVGTGHIGTTKVGTGHIGTTKVGTGHIGTTKVDSRQRNRVKAETSQKYDEDTEINIEETSRAVVKRKSGRKRRDQEQNLDTDDEHSDGGNTNVDTVERSPSHKDTDRGVKIHKEKSKKEKSRQKSHRKTKFREQDTSIDDEEIETSEREIELTSQKYDEDTEINSEETSRAVVQRKSGRKRRDQEQNLDTDDEHSDGENTNIITVEMTPTHKDTDRDVKIHKEKSKKEKSRRKSHRKTKYIEQDTSIDDEVSVKDKSNINLASQKYDEDVETNIEETSRVVVQRKSSRKKRERTPTHKDTDRDAKVYNEKSKKEKSRRKSSSNIKQTSLKEEDDDDDEINIEETSRAVVQRRSGRKRRDQEQNLDTDDEHSDDGNTNVVRVERTLTCQDTDRDIKIHKEKTKKEKSHRKSHRKRSTVNKIPVLMMNKLRQLRRTMK